MAGGRAGIPTGVHVLLEDGGRILLMRRAGTGFFDGLYSLPGGHVEAGESVMMAALREAREELGVMLSPDDMATVGVMHRLSDTNRIDFFVRPARWIGRPVIGEPDKCDDLAWFARDDLPDGVVPYIRQAVLTAQAEPWIIEDGWVERA